MNTIALKDLKPQTYFSKPLFLDEGYVLLAPETPVDEGLVKRMTVWEFREARTDGTSLDAAREDEPEAAGASDEKAAKASLTDGASDREKLEEVLAFYTDFARFMEGLYTRFVTKNELDYKELGERMKRLCQVIGQNRRLLLRAQAAAPQHKNYLVSHAVRTSVYSIILGTALKLPSFKLIELGSAAALHEIGMVRLPPLLYMSGRSLTPQERKAITAHPLLGYNLLKERQIPLSVCLAALEHHERVNGSGYPRSLTGEKISLYSKIIMVACSYDAVTADRPYKEAKDGYSGMVDILKNEGKQYDDIVIRALVYSLSIYPIGTQVMLTNGKKAIVVDINPENPRYPVVQMLGARTPDGKDVVLRTSEAGTRVERPLTKEEIAEQEARG
jgi:HD-GYP domain-containing protein (c-di-GMP phosphodiesterase class II)